ncbi:Membrane metallo-endopeptidase-like 1, partial [Hypsibius exemplaris]
MFSLVSSTSRILVYLYGIVTFTVGSEIEPLAHELSSPSSTVPELATRHEKSLRLQASCFPRGDTGQRICESDHCFQLAREMADTINASVDPCTDFYDYACGNWASRNPMPAYLGNWSRFNILGLKIRAQLRDVLERDDKNDLSTARQKAKTIYKICREHQDRMESAAIEPLLSFLNSTVGSFPILNNSTWNATNFDWFVVTKRVSEFVNGFFLPFYARPDFDNSSRNIISFYAPVPAFLGSRVLYFSKTSEFLRTAFKEYMVNFTTILLGNGSVMSPAVAEQLEEVFQFDTFLAGASRSEEDRRDLSASINKMTLEQFHTQCLKSSISLASLIEFMRNRFLNASLAEVITKDLIVNVEEPNYFTQVGEKIAELSRTPEGRGIIANYYGWRLSFQNAYWLSRKSREATRLYYNAIGGIADFKYRSCENFLAYEMKSVVGSLYARNYFNDTGRSKIAELLQDVRASLMFMLKNADWLDEPTRDKAISKLDQLQDYIGYPVHIVGDIPRLDKEYEKLTPSPEHFKNAVNLAKFNNEQNLGRLSRINNRLEDETFVVASPDAHYRFSSNIIVIVAGILQQPFYDARGPDYLNYAAIGQIIGHELSHAFDDRGSLLDGEGRFQNWWSPGSRSLYNHKAANLVAKYSNYSLPEGSINGLITLGENIADNTGLKAAYKGYQLHVQRKGTPEAILPDIACTADQLFFLAYAQIYCGKTRAKTLKLSLPTSVHSPKKFRVIGSLTNMPEFSDAFRCPVGSPMNPLKKWDI